MNTFECDKCGKKFTYKHHLLRHQNKKIPCDVNLDLPNLPQELPQVTPKFTNFTPRLPQDLPILPQDLPILPQTPPDLPLTNSKSDNKIILVDDSEDIKSKKHKCPHCSNTFTRKDHLKRHIDNRCIVIKNGSKDLKKSEKSEKNNVDINELVSGEKIDSQTKLILTAFMQQINILKDEIKNIKHTTINNTLNNQNIIIAHGTEKFDKVNLDIILNHLSTIKFKDIIPSMTKHLYINDDNPQYKNFCVLDLSRDKCKYHDGKKWIVARTNKKIEKIFDNVHNILTEPFEKENIHKTIEFIQKNPKKFNKKWIDYSIMYLNNLYDEDDKENITKKNEILEELKLIFFNNKDQIIKIKLDKK